MDTITKETYREYLCNRLKDLEKCLELPVLAHESVKIHLEIQRDMDYTMQQLYRLDNEQEED